jgi:replication factor C subunit 3/5
MLWLDKWQPKKLGKMDYHDSLSERMSAMAGSVDVPHLMVYGPPGAGKKTRVMAFLREVFGPGASKLRLEHASFKTPSGKSIDVTTIASNFHVEINAGDCGIYDRIVVQEVIKSVAMFRPLNMGGTIATASETAAAAAAAAAAGPASAASTPSAKGFKMLVLTEVDRLTHAAQHALRRTMEKYSQTCRVILICNAASSVIEPIRSRCLGIRVAAPTHEEVCTDLTKTCKKEGLTLPPDLAMRISRQTKRNLRAALLLLESTKVQSYPFRGDQRLRLPDWREFVSCIANDIVKKQSPQQLLAIRKKFYQLLVNCIPADVVLRTLASELAPKVDEDLRHEIMHWSAFYEHRLTQGRKDIVHLEAFVAKFMSIYKATMLRFAADMGDFDDY